MAIWDFLKSDVGRVLRIGSAIVATSVFITIIIRKRRAVVTGIASMARVLSDRRRGKETRAPLYYRYTTILMQALVTLLIVGPLGNFAYDWLYKNNPPSLRHPLTVLQIAILMITLATAVLFLILRRRAKAAAALAEEGRSKNEYKLLRPCDELSPEDFGFVAGSISAVPIGYRPLAASYIARRYRPLLCADDTEILIEARVLESLQHGKSVILVGPPLEGKTRTLLELARRMTGYIAVTPSIFGSMPSNEALAILAGKHVIVILDDMQIFQPTGARLWDIVEAISSVSSRCVVLATCRQGPEMLSVLESDSTGHRRLFEHIDMKLVLTPMSQSERVDVAQRLGIDPVSVSDRRYPTIGSITMSGTFSAMEVRYERLSREAKAAARALKLLDYAGVRHTENRVEIVTREAFGIGKTALESSHWSDTLSSAGFIRHDGTIIEVDPAYLEAVVRYADGHTSVGLLPSLYQALANAGDWRGLRDLASTLGVRRIQRELFVKCVEAALALIPGNDDNVPDRVYLYSELGRTKEAFSAIGDAEQRGLEPSQASFMRGMVYYGAGDMDNALKSFRAAAEVLRDRGDLLSGIGVTFYLKGLLAEALMYYDLALELNPDDASALYNRGLALRDLNRDGEALRTFRRARAIDPRLHRACFREAEMLLRMHQFGEANRVLDIALTLEPDSPILWSQRAVALLELKQYDDSLDAIRRVIQLDPDAKNHRNAAAILLKINRPAEALAELDKALTLSPHDHECQLSKASVLAVLHGESAAIEFVDGLLPSAGSETDELLVRKAMLLEASGRRSDAIAAMEQALALRSSDRDKSFLLGSWLYEEGRVDEAIKWFECARNTQELEASTAKDSVIWNMLGLCFRVKGDLTSCLNAAEKGLVAAPESTSLLVLNALTLAKIGRHSEARLILDQPEILLADDATVLIDAAEAYMHVGSRSRALASLDACIAKHPKEARAWSLKGSVLIEEDSRLGEAASALAHAVDLQPKDAAAWLNLGVAAAKFGRLDDAIGFFVNSYDLHPGDAALRNLVQALQLSGRKAAADEILAQFGQTEVRESESSDPAPRGSGVVE